MGMLDVVLRIMLLCSIHRAAEGGCRGTEIFLHLHLQWEMYASVFVPFL